MITVNPYRVINKIRRNADRTDLSELTRDVWRIILLNKDNPFIYYQETSMSLVQLNTEKSGALTIVPATVASIAFLLSDLIDFYRERPASRAKNAPIIEVDAKPPQDLIQMILGNPPEEIPRLYGITNIPYFTKTGRLVEKPGYDEESGLYLRPIVDVPPVPKNPTSLEIYKALKIIYRIIQDFPFESKTDRANLLALMLLLPAREMISGPTPIHLIEAATPGTGKSLIVQALLSPLLGISPTMRGEPKDDAEWAKDIGTAMLSGERLYVVDNINNALMSGTLSNAVVSNRFSTRALGYNKNIKGEIKWAWVMTGNNVKASMEVARRIVRTRIVAPAERPWERKQENFHTPRLMRWVEMNSDLVCCAALTLVQAWVVNGMKEGKGNLGSFERWAEVMSGILDCVGIKGFLENVNESFDDIAEETASWSDFVKIWWSTHTDVLHPAKDLYDLLALNGIDLDLHGDSDSARTASLAKKLGLQKDKVFDQYRITKGKGRNRRMWQLQKVSA
jgi:hypothetical protein